MNDRSQKEIESPDILFRLLWLQETDQNQRGPLLACVTGKSRDLTVSVRIFFLSPPSTPTFLCWIYSLVDSLHMLASDNSSFIINW